MDNTLTKECEDPRIEQQLTKEYDNLRSEIHQLINLQNSSLTFTVTSSLAVITLAVANQLPILLLLSFCILIPMAARIRNYGQAVMKLSAYMITFLEPNLNGLSWETRNKAYYQVRQELHPKRKRPNLKYHECTLIALVSYSLYVYYSLPAGESGFFPLSQWTVFNYGQILLPFLLVILVGYITFGINRGYKERARSMEIWKAVMEKEPKGD